MNKGQKTVYDALLKFVWNERISKSVLLNDTRDLLLQHGANLNKCDISVYHDRDKSYVKIMPNCAMDDFSSEELQVFANIADIIESKMAN